MPVWGHMSGCSHVYIPAIVSGGANWFQVCSGTCFVCMFHFAVLSTRWCAAGQCVVFSWICCSFICTLLVLGLTVMSGHLSLLPLFLELDQCIALMYTVSQFFTEFTDSIWGAFAHFRVFPVLVFYFVNRTVLGVMLAVSIAWCQWFIYSA